MVVRSITANEIFKGGCWMGKRHKRWIKRKGFGNGIVEAIVETDESLIQAVDAKRGTNGDDGLLVVTNSDKTRH